MTAEKENWIKATELLHKAVEYFNSLSEKKATYNDIESLRHAVEVYHVAGYISYQDHKYMNMINARINKCTPGGKAGYLLMKMMEKRRHMLELEILKKAEKFRILVEKHIHGRCFWCLETIENIQDHSCDCLKLHKMCVEVNKNG